MLKHLFFAKVIPFVLTAALFLVTVAAGCETVSDAKDRVASESARLQTLVAAPTTEPGETQPAPASAGMKSESTLEPEERQQDPEPTVEATPDNKPKATEGLSSATAATCDVAPSADLTPAISFIGEYIGCITTRDGGGTAELRLSLSENIQGDYIGDLYLDPEDGSGDVDLASYSEGILTFVVDAFYSIGMEGDNHVCQYIGAVSLSGISSGRYDCTVSGSAEITDSGTWSATREVEKDELADLTPAEVTAAVTKFVSSEEKWSIDQTPRIGDDDILKRASREDASSIGQIVGQSCKKTECNYEVGIYRLVISNSSDPDRAIDLEISDYGTSSNETCKVWSYTSVVYRGARIKFVGNQWFRQDQPFNDCQGYSNEEVQKEVQRLSDKMLALLVP